MKDELQDYFQEKVQQNPLNFKNVWKKLAYLADTFHCMNLLKKSLQGPRKKFSLEVIQFLGL